jgi:TetR/AcrR family transcriptional repressor of nem operon
MARPQEFDKSEVLHKALGVFWQNGYEATSMTDLLKATGLSKSSLYNTFGNKHKLLVTAFDAYREDRMRDMDCVLDQGSAPQAIETFFRMIITDAQAPEFRHGCMSINQAVEMAPHDPEIRSRVEADFQCIEDALTRTIERGQREGSVKGDKNARQLAQLMVVVFPGLQVLVRARSNHTRLEEALSLLLSHLE